MRKRKRRKRKETYGTLFQSEGREKWREYFNFCILTSSSFLHGRKSGKDEDSGADTHEVGANETINVFSIASGHLYERFLRYIIHVCMLLALVQMWSCKLSILRVILEVVSYGYLRL